MRRIIFVVAKAIGRQLASRLPCWRVQADVDQQKWWVACDSHAVKYVQSLEGPSLTDLRMGHTVLRTESYYHRMYSF